MDALTDILRTVHLRGSVYCRSEMSAPWGIAVPTSEAAQFHVVRRGRCWLSIEESARVKPTLLESGDVVLVPQGHAHILVDEPSTVPESLAQLIAEQEPKVCGTPLRHGGGGDEVTLICGYFTFESSAVHPLLSVLPPLITVRGEGGRARSWLMSTLDLIAEESVTGRPGGETLIDRLSEALFIQVLRTHLEEDRRTTPSWLAGLRDPQIARVLALIHRHPDERWTVEALAQRLGMSRSAFSSRFRALVGEPPLSYVTRWRMQVAAVHLREAQLTLPEIAERVGYQAEASFSKIFKKAWGVAPATYRRQVGAASAP